MTTPLTIAQANCLSYAICNTDSKINFSAALKDINGTRTIRALINKYYLAQYETAEGIVTVVTQSGLDALIAYYKKVGLDYDAKVVEQTYFDHFAADHKVASQLIELVCNCGECYDCTKSVAYEATFVEFKVGDHVQIDPSARTFMHEDTQHNLARVVSLPDRNGYLMVECYSPKEQCQLTEIVHISAVKYQGTSVTPAAVVADMLTLIKVGDRVKLTSDALYFGPNDDRIAAILDFPYQDSYFWATVTINGYEARKLLHVSQIEVLNPFQ